MARLRVLTWNINGLRRVVAAFGSLQRLLEALQPADVICFQETKLTRGDLRRELALVDGWESFFAFTRGKVGYSGVATFCRRDRTVPLHAEEGFTGVLELPPGSRPSGGGPLAAAALHPRWHSAGWSVEELRNLDGEGRVVITDHGAFVLVNVYGPAITSEERAEERMSYKMDFYRALQLRLDGFLSEGRRVVLLGDLNIAPDVIDVCGATPRDFDARRADRAWLRGLLSRGRSSNSGNSNRVRERGAAAAAAAAAAGRGRGNGGNVCEDEEVEVDLEEDVEGWEQCRGSGGFGGSGSGGVGLPPFVDTFRAFHPTRQHAYTCWNTSSGARVNNYGSRIDHVLVADGSGGNSSSNRGCGDGGGGGGGSYTAAEHTGVLAACAPAGGSAIAAVTAAGAAAACGCLAWVVAADIMPDMDGSDHAPAWVELELQDDQLTRGSAAGGPPPPLSSRGLFDASRQATLHAVLSRRPQAATAQTLADSLPPAAASSAPLCGGSSVASAGAAAARLHRSASCSAVQIQKAGGGCGGGGWRKGGSGTSAAAGGASQKKLTAFMRPKAPLAIEGAAKSGMPPGGGGGGGANGGEGSSLPEAPYGVTNGGVDSRSVDHGQQGTASQQSPQPLRYQAELHPQSHHHRHHQHHQHRHGAAPQHPQEPWQRREQAQQQKGLNEWAQPGSPVCGCSVPTADTAGMVTGCGNNGGGELCRAAPGGFPRGTSNSGPLETAGFRPLGPPTHMSSGGGAPADYQPLLYGEYDVMARHDDRQGQQGPAGQQSRGLWTAAGAQDELLAVTEQAKAEAAAEASEALPAAGRSQAALAWRQIQDQMKPPRCSGHGEPCVVRTVKKRGENNGRQFWCCARPDGLPPNGRCDFFQWARGRNLLAGAAAGSGAGGSPAADTGPAGGGGPGGAKGPAAGARQQQQQQQQPGSSGAGRGGGSGGGGRAVMSNMPRKKPRT